MATNVKGIDLKIMRLKAGIRQYDLAARLGIPSNRLSEMESGRRQPSAELLQRLVQILEQGKNREARDEG